MRGPCVAALAARSRRPSPGHRRRRYAGPTRRVRSNRRRPAPLRAACGQSAPARRPETRRRRCRNRSPGRARARVRVPAARHSLPSARRGWLAVGRRAPRPGPRPRCGATSLRPRHRAAASSPTPAAPACRAWQTATSPRAWLAPSARTSGRWLAAGSESVRADAAGTPFPGARCRTRGRAGARCRRGCRRARRPTGHCSTRPEGGRTGLQAPASVRHHQCSERRWQSASPGVRRSASARRASGAARSPARVARGAPVRLRR